MYGVQYTKTVKENGNTGMGSNGKVILPSRYYQLIAMVFSVSFIYYIYSILILLNDSWDVIIFRIS